MKKHQFLLVALLFLCTSIGAQSVKKAHKLFSLKAYAEAAKIYETQTHSFQTLKNLGDSYYFTTDMKNAIKTYRELYSKYGKKLDNEYHFRYGQALKGLQKYTEADKHLSLYYKNTINTSQFIEKTEKKTPHVFKLEALEGLGHSGNFGLAFIKNNEITFASTRDANNPNYAWNNAPYLNIYRAKIYNNEIADIKLLKGTVNTKSHESNAIFTKDGKTMYFNRTRKKKTKTSTSEIGFVNLYRAELIDGEWTNVTSLPFNSNAFNIEHPALSKDEKTLYFSSDMPGSFGSFDIYKVKIKANGAFGTPENLGNKINTKHREQFPYISDLNVLYFTSDGHEGYGGLDIFRSSKINKKYDTPINLGAPLNTHLDDFAYTINERDNTGYISSNRSGDDTIYFIKRKDNRLTKFVVEGVVQDKNSKKLLPGSLVSLFDETGTVLKDSVVNNTANYSFKIEPNKKYKIRGTCKFYIPYDVEFSTNSKGEITKNIFLNLESYADAEDRITKNEKGDTQIKLQKIFFEFNKANITSEAATVINTLVKLLKKYPEMKIEISAHTDVRGDAKYNLKLSKKRARSALNYLVSQGIQKNRLKSIGYGEMQPLNHCDKENMCAEADYDINRRCEFKILN